MLDDSQYYHLDLLLDGLSTVMGQLDNKSKNFVEQTKERFDKYEYETFISAKQLDWLESLYKKYVGPI